VSIRSFLRHVLHSFLDGMNLDAALRWLTVLLHPTWDVPHLRATSLGTGEGFDASQAVLAADEMSMAVVVGAVDVVL
jgi:hypothetical protein